MKSALFLRIASGLTVVHAILHTIGGVFGQPAPEAEGTLSLMKSNQFPVMGLMRSYWDFYHGMGLAVSIFLLIEGIVFWQLGTMAKTEGARLRPILLAFLLGYLCLAVNSALYFFAGPLVTEILIALCLGLAIRGSKMAA